MSKIRVKHCRFTFGLKEKNIEDTQKIIAEILTNIIFRDTKAEIFDIDLKTICFENNMRWLVFSFNFIKNSANKDLIDKINLYLYQFTYHINMEVY